MSISELPLAVFRDILDLVLIEVGYQQSLNLRLVNRIFDYEVLLAYERVNHLKSALLLPPSSLRREGSLTEFVARYLPQRPYQSASTPNSDPSTLISYVLDEIDKLQEARSTSAERHECVKKLCRLIGGRIIANALFKTSKDAPPFSTSETRNHVIVAAVYLGKYPAVKIRLDSKSIKIDDVQSDCFGTPLDAALMTSQYDVTRDLLDRGANPNLSTKQWDPPLLLASSNSNLALVQLLLDPKYGCSTSSQTFQAALIDAIRLQNLDMFHFLLRHSAEPISKMHEAIDRGLWFAAYHGYLDIVSMLMDHYVDDPESVLISLQPGPVEVAAWKGHEDVLRCLLAKGASPYGREQAGRRDHSMCAVAWSGHVGTTRILLDAGLQLDGRQWAKVLEIAAPLKQSAEFFRFLLDEGHVDLSEIRDDDFLAEEFSRTYMCLACKHGNVEVVKALVKHGVSLSDEGMYGRGGYPLPIVTAIAYQQDAIVEALRGLGSPKVDPENSCWARRFESGEFPSRPSPPTQCRMPWSTTLQGP